MATTDPEILRAVSHALEEDIGSGDITSEATVPAGTRATGRYFARQQLVVAGLGLLPVIFDLRGGVERLETKVRDGDRVEPGTELASATGSAHTLLACERVSLNFLQRLSGVATLARRYAGAVAGTHCKVLDTRKTTPGLRTLEKMAAAAGGITNHRLGLWDAILIKNNHITAAGGVKPALERAFATGKPVEIEVRTRQELEEALAAGAKALLLDNLTPVEATEWIRYIAGRATVELSGNITLETVRAYAETGADFVSSGAITHSAPAVDLNFRLEWLR